MKYLFTMLIFLIPLYFSLTNTYAETGTQLTENITLSSETQKKGHLVKKTDFSENIKVGENLKIDLSKIEKDLNQKLNLPIEFEWSLKGSTTQEGSTFERVFQEYGQKTINLNIYKKENDKKKLITSEDITLFVYTNKSHIIFDTSLGREQINQYIHKSRDIGIFVEKIAEISEKEIEKQNFLELIEKYNIYDIDSLNYITIWGEKEFISGTLSKINKERSASNSDIFFNIVLVSPFNTDVLKSYLRNFLSNKTWVQSILLIPESSTSQIRYNPSNIENLEKDLNNKQYENLNINTKSQISQVLFISQFINTLSNSGFASSGIFLILLIPFLFTGISVFKHLIGLSPIGALIPIGLTLLFFQIGLIPAVIILSTLIFLNLGLSKITNKYTLLYTPKISFIIIINIAIIMMLINILFNYNLLESSISDIIFIILFVLISERLITVILSKEFGEYRLNLLNTILFAILSYAIFSVSFIQVVVFAYPEIILMLIPINFIIGRFTGLRITEYFRFKEVIKSIEE